VEGIVSRGGGGIRPLACTDDRRADRRKRLAKHGHQQGCDDREAPEHVSRARRREPSQQREIEDCGDA
jgi:hypothetical protein